MTTRVYESNAKTWKDLRALTGLGEIAVKAGILSGELPGYKVGKFYVIPAEAFDAFARGEWIPKPRPIFTRPVQTTPTKFIHRKEA